MKWEVAGMSCEAGKCTEPSFIGMFCHQDLSQDFRCRMEMMAMELKDRPDSSQAMFVCLPVFGRSAMSTRRKEKEEGKAREEKGRGSGEESGACKN